MVEQNDVTAKHGDGAAKWRATCWQNVAKDDKDDIIDDYIRST